MHPAKELLGVAESQRRDLADAEESLAGAVPTTALGPTELATASSVNDPADRALASSVAESDGLSVPWSSLPEWVQAQVQQCHQIVGSKITTPCFKRYVEALHGLYLEPPGVTAHPEVRSMASDLGRVGQSLAVGSVQKQCHGLEAIPRSPRSSPRCDDQSLC